MTHESGSNSDPEDPDTQPSEPPVSPPYPTSPPPAEPPTEPPTEPPASPPPDEPPGSPPYPTSPPPAYGVGPSGAPSYAQPAYGQPYPQHPYAGHPGYGPPMRDPDARPGTVTAAAIVTFVVAGLSLLLLLLMLLALVAARDSFLEGFQEESGLSGQADAWFTGILVVLLVLVAWCVVAIALGVLAMRRRNWARIALAVSSAVTVLLSLVAIASGLSLVNLVAGIAVIICLFTGGAGDWFHREHLYSPPQMPKL